MMKGPGSWSVESSHGGALLDWESRKIVKQIDVEIKNVVCFQSLSPCSIWFFCLGFLVWYGSLRWPIHLRPSIQRRLQRKTWWCGIADDEGVEGEEVFEIVEVSEEVSPKLPLPPTNYQTLCQDGHKDCWSLHENYSKRLYYFFSLSTPLLSRLPISQPILSNWRWRPPYLWQLGSFTQRRLPFSEETQK